RCCRPAAPKSVSAREAHPSHRSPARPGRAFDPIDVGPLHRLHRADGWPVGPRDRSRARRQERVPLQESHLRPLEHAPMKLIHIASTSSACSLSHREKGGVRGYGLSRNPNPLTPTLSPIRAFTPVFDGLWGRGGALSKRLPIQVRRNLL